MSRSARAFIFIVVFAIMAIVTGTGCASAQKIKYSTRKGYKKPESSCDLAHLGRNKYFYSVHYKKILQRSVKKIGR
jgi:hypothetical protein